MADAPDLPSVVFVYGTLKSGQSNRALLAPHIVRSEAAEVEGVLYDLGDFPGLVPGSERVQGEAVWIRPDRMQQVVPVLDRLEQHVPGQPKDSYYLREVVPVRLSSGDTVWAWAYFYNEAHPDLLPITYLSRVSGGVWNGPRESGQMPERMKAYSRKVREFSEAKGPSET